MKRYAIILAGGEGRRAGGDIPKQLQLLCGKPVLWWSVNRFVDADPDTRVILVMHPGLFADWDAAVEDMSPADRFPYTICCGGRSRTESVANALITLRELLDADGAPLSEAAVAIHDAARPLVSREVINAAWNACAPGVAAVPAVDCSSSLRLIDKQDGSRSIPVDRSLYREVQTPQVAIAADLVSAYDASRGENFTDDASLLQHHGVRVSLVEGSHLNIKITYPLDLKIAETIMMSDSGLL